jgi:signal transduction histidine kinase/CheY-like chemotaxis protein/HPt (histidine-containing phosphotransfer) domain-containing protein
MALTSTTEDEGNIKHDSKNSHWLIKEKARLSNLLEYDLSDLDIDENILTPITTLVAMICEMPLSFVTWVGPKRVDFLARDGCQYLGTSRESSFCDLAIEQDDIFEIEDSLNDPRFSENEFVKEQQTPLTFYAGYPLKSSKGYNLGSLCVCDTKPNKLNDKQRLALKTLTQQVMAQLELKKQNKKLIEANKKAEVLSRAKDDFISNVSHELRTPLNAINGYANILGQSILNKDQEEAVNIIKNSSEILITLVNDILDFSKINSEKLKLEKIPFDLEKTVKLVNDLLYKKAEEKNISLEMIYDEKIPKKLVGDKIRINQIIMNLAGNSIKFTQKGKVIIEVKVSENKLEQTSSVFNINSNVIGYETRVTSKKSLNILTRQVILNFSVRDTGIGIPADKIDSIFERFEQAGTDITRRFGGTGLGLNISKNLVELHGGNLKVKSVFGEGSEFYFTIPYDFIPVKETNKERNQISDLHKLNQEYFSKLAKLRVLVCEDNLVNIKLIKHLFKNKITYLEVAENGRIGVELFKTKPFDVIIMDLHMPEMDGIEATKYIRNKLKSKIPIIGFTANCSNEEKELCLKVGMNDYLTKTFVNNDIYKKLADIILISKEYLEDDDLRQKYIPPKKRVKSHTGKFCTKLNIIDYRDECSNKNLNDLGLYFVKSSKLEEDIDIDKQDSVFKGQKKKIYSSVNVINKLNKLILTNSTNSQNSSIKSSLKDINLNRMKRGKSSRKSSIKSNFINEEGEFRNSFSPLSNERISKKNSSKIIKSSENIIFEYSDVKSDKVIEDKYTPSSFFKPNLDYDNSFGRNSSEDSEDFENFNLLQIKELQVNDKENYDHIELTALKEMSSDEDFEKEIIEYFLENFPQEIKSLVSDITNNNKKQVKLKVHKMKTPLGLLGLKKIIEKLEKLESLCNNDQNERAIWEFKYLSENMNIIYNELKGILKKYN